MAKLKSAVHYFLVGLGSVLTVQASSKLASGGQNRQIRTMNNPLQQELETFEQLKDQLLQDEGKYAVISGKELLGVYSSYDDALQIGYERYNLTPFLVKKISTVEPINFFTRDIPTPCLT